MTIKALTDDLEPGVLLAEETIRSTDITVKRFDDDELGSMYLTRLKLKIGDDVFGPVHLLPNELFDLQAVIELAVNAIEADPAVLRSTREREAS